MRCNDVPTSILSLNGGVREGYPLKELEKVVYLFPQ